jgi:hypothetical protein
VQNGGRPATIRPWSQPDDKTTSSPAVKAGIGAYP